MFGIDLMDAGLLTAIFVALLGGILSFLSPCVLPIVPPYLAYMSGISLAEIERGGQARRQAVIAAVFFVMGLSTVFLILGFAISAFGQFFLQNQVLFGRIAGIVVIAFALHFLGIFRIPFLYREARIDAEVKGGSMLGAYILGLAFAFGWTPCIGPVLGAILSMAASEASLDRGLLLMAVYAAGLGIPFLLVALFINRALGMMKRLRRHMGLIEKAMGLLLLVIGLMLLTGTFSALSYWLLENLPALSVVG